MKWSFYCEMDETGSAGCKVPDILCVVPCHDWKGNEVAGNCQGKRSIQIL